MQTKLLNQALSLSLAALTTLVILVGIDHQAQAPVPETQLAHVVTPQA